MTCKLTLDTLEDDIRLSDGLTEIHRTYPTAELGLILRAGGPVAEISHLRVLEDARGSGVASALVRTIIESLQKTEIEYVEAFVGLTGSYTGKPTIDGVEGDATVALLRKFGFEITGIEPGSETDWSVRAGRAV